MSSAPRDCPRQASTRRVRRPETIHIRSLSHWTCVLLPRPRFRRQTQRQVSWVSPGPFPAAVNPFRTKSLTSVEDSSTRHPEYALWYTDYLEPLALEEQQTQERLSLNSLICLKSDPPRNSAVTDPLLEGSPTGKVGSCHRRGDTTF